MLFDGTTLHCYKLQNTNKFQDGPILHLATSFADLNSLALGLQTGNFIFRQIKWQLPTAIKKKKDQQRTWDFYARV